MDQRWPGTGWRERPTRYHYLLLFLSVSLSLLSKAFSVFIALSLSRLNNAGSH